MYSQCMDDFPIYTVAEVATMFRRSKQTVWNRVRSSEWPALREGRNIFFGQEQIDTIRDIMNPAPAEKLKTDRERFKANLPLARHL